MIECSEEAEEEEYFGGDKEDYSVPKAFLNGRCMVSLKCTFSDYVSSSLAYSQDKEGGA